MVRKSIRRDFGARLSLAGFAAVAILSVGVFPAAGAAGGNPSPHLLTRADVLPLALDPAFAFRKTLLYFLESAAFKQVRGNDERSLAFERNRLLYGAITVNDERARYGNYFTFFWRIQRSANLSVRLEYRQERLGPYVQAREIDYPDARPGSYRSEFSIIGNDYAVDGRVTAWRALLVERDGGRPRIVALTQSALWR